MVTSSAWDAFGISQFASVVGRRHFSIGRVASVLTRINIAKIVRIRAKANDTLDHIGRKAAARQKAHLSQGFATVCGGRAKAALPESQRAPQLTVTQLSGRGVVDLQAVLSQFAFDSARAEAFGTYANAAFDEALVAEQLQRLQAVQQRFDIAAKSRVAVARAGVFLA